MTDQDSADRRDPFDGSDGGIGDRQHAGPFAVATLVAALAVLAAAPVVAGAAPASGSTSTGPAASTLLPDCSTVTYAGNGTAADPYEVATVDQLQCIGNASTETTLSDSYVQVADIDAGATTGFDGGEGFEPIGSRSTSFTGTYDGNGFRITGLFVERTGNADETVGLFARVDGGTVRNVALVNADVTADAAVGGLVGVNDGTVADSYVTGSVEGTGANEFGQTRVGALVGNNRGTVTGSNASATVTSRNAEAGGLVGRNVGTVARSSATGAVDGLDRTGGLVGQNLGSVTDVYATGDVSGDASVGGLVGENDGSIGSGVYATGAVTATGARVGGLVGYDDAAVDLVDVRAEGDVAGQGQVGGLVGRTDGGDVVRSHAVGSVTSSGDEVGGLVGSYGGTGGEVLFSYATGDVGTGEGTDLVGGLVGTFSGRRVLGSYATGQVTGDKLLGGLIGRLDSGRVVDVYARGDVTGNTTNDIASRIGGLVGRTAGGEVVRGYATGAVGGNGFLGGLVADQDARLADSYWDVLATGESTANDTGSGVNERLAGFAADDGTGRALEMLGDNAPSNMTAFDFAAVWATRSNDYPVLAYQDGNGPPYAVGESYTVDGRLAVSAPGVLGNDLDPEGDALSVTGVAVRPTNGTLTLAADGGFEYAPDPGFVGTDSFAYEVGDGTGTATRTVALEVVDSPPAIDVSIANTTGPVVEGDRLAVRVDATNVGDSTGTANVSLTVAGTVRDEATVSPAPGNDETATLNWTTTDGDAGDYNLTVESTAGSDEAPVTVRPADTTPPGSLSVSIQFVSREVRAGDPVRAVAVVENVGGERTSQRVTLSAGGTTRDGANVTLAPNETRTVELAWETAPGDAGEYDVRVASEDDAAVRRAVVTAAAPEVTVTMRAVTGPAEPGEPVRVSAVVSNELPLPTTLQASLVAGDVQVADDVVRLPPSGVDDAAFRWVPDGDAVGDRSLAVVAAGESAGTSVAVRRDDDTLRPTAVTARTNGTLRVSLRNVGSDPSNDTVELRVDGSPVDYGVATVAPDGETTISFETDALTDGDSHRVAVVTADGRLAGSLAPGETVRRDPGDGTVTGPGDGTGNESDNATAPGLDVTDDGNRSTDVDGDGVHEDVDGDGDFDTADVQALLDGVVEGDAAAAAQFDVDGDGAVTADDVQALLDELVA